METNGDGERAAYRVMIRDMPAIDRPRERLRDAGAEALSSAELIAILLRTGTSKQSALDQATALLARFEGLPGLARASFAELCNVHGFGEAKASQLKAAIELGVRVGRQLSPDDRPIVRSPDDIAALVMAEMSLLEQESVRVMLLDARNHVLGIREVYHGSVHTTQVRIAEMFREAVRATAPAIVVLHNHPSGDPAPSAADVQMTKMLVEAGKLLDIEVYDHLVIGGGRYVSMRSMRLGFTSTRTEG